MACDILSICLSSLDLNTEKDNNFVLLDDMVRHTNEEVKIIGLTQLERLVKKNPQTLQSPATIVDVIKCLEVSNTTAGTLAMKILAIVLSTHFDSSEVKDALEAAGTSSTSKCRVYEVVVGMACESSQNMQKAGTIIERIVTDLSSGDILLQLNILEILSSLVSLDYGLTYLEELGLFPRLLTALENIDMMHILFPGFIKFFASIANSHPDKIFTKYSHICKPLFETIISNDSSTLGPCLDTLGVLGRSKQGKIGLSALNLVCPDGDMKMVLMEMAMFLCTLPTEEQIRILNCLELLFMWDKEAEGNSMPDNRISTITEGWYKFLDKGPGLKVLMSYCRNPFPDIKLAGFGVIKSIADYSWGRAAISETAGLIEYLLDRGADFNTEAFQAKYDILLCLNVQNNELSEGQRAEVKDYVAKGPFYKKGITDVAMERE